MHGCGCDGCGGGEDTVVEDHSCAREGRFNRERLSCSTTFNLISQL